MVLGSSSDCDTRLLKLQRAESGLGTDKVDSKWEEFYRAFHLPVMIHVQDISHYWKKMRMRYIRRSLNLVLAKSILTTLPLKQLLKQDGIRLPYAMSDLDHNDKMNVDAAGRICSLQTEMELKNLKGTEALQIFLRLMRYPAEAFGFNELSDLDRIYKIWYSVFVARAWKSKSPATEFLSYQCYLCLELDAHSLLALHKKCRDMKRTDLFNPGIINSQTCESLFREMRSLSPIICHIKSVWSCING